MNKKGFVLGGLEIVIVLIIIILFIVFSKIDFKDSLTIQLTRDSVSLPGTVYVEVFEEDFVKSMKLEGKFTGDSTQYGVCVPRNSAPRNQWESICKSYGHQDWGCNWNAETACDCRSYELGCYGSIPNYPINPKIIVAGEVVYEKSGQFLGDFETPDFANIVNEYCDLNTDFVNNEAGECSVPIEIKSDRGGQITSFRLIASAGTVCVPNLECSITQCSNGEKTQTCIDKNGCLTQNQVTKIDCQEEREEEKKDVPKDVDVTIQPVKEEPKEDKQETSNKSLLQRIINWFKGWNFEWI